MLKARGCFWIWAIQTSHTDTRMSLPRTSWSKFILTSKKTPCSQRKWSFSCWFRIQILTSNRNHHAVFFRSSKTEASEARSQAMRSRTSPAEANNREDLLQLRHRMPAPQGSSVASQPKLVEGVTKRQQKCGTKKLYQIHIEHYKYSILFVPKYIKLLYNFLNKS